MRSYLRLSRPIRQTADGSNRHRSTLSDDFLVLHVPNDYDSLIESVFKTELVVLLMDKAREVNKTIALNFNDTYVHADGACWAPCVTRGTDVRPAASALAHVGSRWGRTRSIEYLIKKGKKAKVSFVKDPTVRAPTIKGGVVRVPEGMPKDSRTFAVLACLWDAAEGGAGLGHDVDLARLWRGVRARTTRLTER